MLLGLATLPLHVWDRELDARILLASLLVNDGHQVLLGHEYNISQVYKSLPHIFHYGAGRPIYNEPRTNNWYEPIISNDGYVGLVFEEGINDNLFDESMSSISYPGINDRSVASTSKVFAWCQKEITQMCSACSDNKFLSESLNNLSLACANTRIEMLSLLGTNYFQDYIYSLQNLFGDYVLISDNFGLEVFGVGAPLNARNQYRWVQDSHQVQEFVNTRDNHLKMKSNMRNEFSKVINHLISKNPSTNFIFRPHPVADPQYWYLNLKPARNLHIICRDNPVPWLKQASTVIHAGCTLGLEAELASIPAIDISRIYHDIHKPSVHLCKYLQTG